MKNLMTIIGLICMIVFAGCEKEFVYLEPDELDAIPVIVDKALHNQSAVAIQDLFSIEGGEINGDILKLTVSFTGGCEEHKFRLIVSTIFLQSKPPKAFVLLTHDAKDDTCTQSIMEELRYDLTPLKEHFQQLGTTSEVHFRVKEPPLFEGNSGVYFKYKF